MTTKCNVWIFIRYWTKENWKTQLPGEQLRKLEHGYILDDTESMSSYMSMIVALELYRKMSLFPENTHYKYLGVNGSVKKKKEMHARGRWRDRRIYNLKLNTEQIDNSTDPHINWTLYIQYLEMLHEFYFHCLLKGEEIKEKNSDLKINRGK